MDPRSLGGCLFNAPGAGLALVSMLGPSVPRPRHLALPPYPLIIDSVWMEFEFAGAASPVSPPALQRPVWAQWLGSLGGSWVAEVATPRVPSHSLLPSLPQKELELQLLILCIRLEKKVIG